MERNKETGEIFLTRKEIKAFLAFASNDPFRPHICTVGVDDGRGAVFATDGHTMLVFQDKSFERETNNNETFWTWNVTRQALEIGGKDRVSILKADMRVTVSSGGHSVDGTCASMPVSWDQVMPKRDESEIQTAALDTQYLKRLDLVTKAIGLKNGEGCTEMIVGTKFAPVVFQWILAPQWRAVIMPMSTERVIKEGRK